LIKEDDDSTPNKNLRKIMRGAPQTARYSFNYNP
jgi:hypothetical protein